MPTRARSRLSKQLRVIRASLNCVDRDLRRLAPLVRAVVKTAGRSTKTTRRKLRLSPARRRECKRKVEELVAVFGRYRRIREQSP